MKQLYELIGIIIIAVALFFLGYYFGGKTTTEVVQSDTTYVSLSPIHDTITKFETVTETLPTDTLSIIQECIKKGIYSELFPTKIITDTMVFTREDTSAIITDWATRRLYTETLFDVDTLGKCIVNMDVQYNRMDKMSYTFTPVAKTINTTVVKHKIIEPYIGVGATSLISLDAELGMFIKEHYGLGVKYQYDISDKKHVFGGMFYYKL